jgi:hypothetical protein
VVSAPESLLALIPSVEADLRSSGLIEQLETARGETLRVDVELAPPDAAAHERTP